MHNNEMVWNFLRMNIKECFGHEAKRKVPKRETKIKLGT
jgi:hypothetical protein